MIFWQHTFLLKQYPQGVLMIIQGGKVQYITKQKEKNVLALASGFLTHQKYAKFSSFSIGQN